jgi:hypothetical protein
MSLPISSGDILTPLLLVKAILAILAVLLFAYYKVHWDSAKKLLPIHFFYAKWRAVRHAMVLGLAAIGFAIGFTIELIGSQAGLSSSWLLFLSSLFEAGALLCILFVFFELSLEDVPHFQHLSDTAKRRTQHKQTPLPHHMMEAGKTKAIKIASGKKGKRRKR